MATVIPQIVNWSVTPQNGQEDYFTKMNIWLSESTNVISSANTSITKMNEKIEDINNIALNAINAITFDNIAQLKLNSNMGRVDVLGYYTKGDGGGGLFYWDSTSTETDNGGTVIQATGITTGRWKRVIIDTINVKWFGAKGDAIADDTISINKALYIGGKIIFPKGIYNFSSTLEYNNNKDIFIKTENAVLNNVGTELNYGLYINPSGDINYCKINNLIIKGNNNISVGIYVNTNSKRIYNINVSNNIIDNLNNGLIARNVVGIIVNALNSSVLKIDSNFIFNINRTSVNSGIIASVGIGVYNLNTVAEISNNAINGIFSPTGDADADGIQVFSNNRLESNVIQTSQPIIYGNRIQQCKGRFIKLQCANGKVYNNYLSNVGNEVIDNFMCIDSQIGGVSIYDNTIRIGSTSGGVSLAIFSLQFKTTGDFENISTVINNKVILERNIPYFALLTPVANSNAVVNIENNIVGDKSSTYYCSNFVYASIPLGLLKYHIFIKNNKVASATGSFFRFNTTNDDNITNDSTGPALADIMFLEITNNTNTKTGVIGNAYYSPSIGMAYIKNVLMHSNVGVTNRIDAKGLSLSNLPVGNSFYYGTDGSTGGIIDAPSGYDRYVIIEKINNDYTRVTLVLANKFIIKKTSPTVSTYEYTGVVK